MEFIEAVVKIVNSDEFELCDNTDELTGTLGSICVFYKDEFVGKLRWPQQGADGSMKSAGVDAELEERLKETAP